MLKKIYLILSIAILSGTTTIGQPLQLSNNSTISLLTCGAGNEYYLSFGHSAIRVCDTSQNIDFVFNYGVFDFNTPNLYLKFALGNLDYMLDVQSYNNFILSYQYEGRWVAEQKLNLTFEERNKLFNLLRENYKKENRYYKYDFFRDNCATRARDIIEKSLNRDFYTNNSVNTDNTYRNLINQTFREIIYPYTNERLMWWQFGVDALLGMRCDRPVSVAECMFIPFYLQEHLNTINLCESSTLILDETKTDNPKSISPIVVFWILCFITCILTYISSTKKIKIKWFDIPLFSLVGIIGLVVAMMWAFSSHWCVKENLNILWANPIFLLLIFCPKRANKYIIYTLLTCLFLALLNIIIHIQHYNSAVLPIVISLIIRLSHLLYNERRIKRAA